VIDAEHWWNVLKRANYIDETKRDLGRIRAKEPNKAQAAEDHVLTQDLKQWKSDQSIALGLTKREPAPGRRGCTSESECEARSLSKSTGLLSARRSTMYFPS
jgi:hypothetical protein